MRQEVLLIYINIFIWGSAANSSAHYDEDDGAFASEQGRESNDEQEHETVQESSTYFNYHTHMNKTPRGRWTKQDTELFYEVCLPRVLFLFMQ